MLALKPYADLPARRARQVLSDGAVLAWVALWSWLGVRVHDVTLGLAEPGRRLQVAGTGFRDTMSSAGAAVDDLPLLQDRVAEPFRTASGAGTDIAGAGEDLVRAVERLALALGWLTALLPIVLVGGAWLVVRVRFAVRAGAAQRFVDGAPDLDLFALRSLSNQPMPRLAAISDDPAGAWRRGEPDTIRRLAVLELRDCGLRPPPGTSVSG
ncbi:MAG TPA: hypothetical protein VES95_05430 [Dermatophilaceae bacterium]|nr:hypothetical protein [Dermatophilaceae bacterium]